MPGYLSVLFFFFSFLSFLPPSLPLSLSPPLSFFFFLFFKKILLLEISIHLLKFGGYPLDMLHTCLPGISLYHDPKKFFHIFYVLEPLTSGSHDFFFIDLLSGFAGLSSSFLEKRCMEDLSKKFLYTIFTLE